MALVTSAAGAQEHTALRGPAVTRDDLAWLAGAAATSALLVNVDARLRTGAMESSIQRSGPARSTLDAAREIGGPGALAFSAALWGFGRATGRDAVERTGLRAAEAILIAGTVTSALKGLTGRVRPDHDPLRDPDPRAFGLGRGIRDGSGYDSFPSGHATVAFALASAVHAEWGRLSPKRPRWVGPAVYAAASLTAASRVFDDRHWTSDVVMGSVIGVVSGRAVVRWHADRP